MCVCVCVDETDQKEINLGGIFSGLSPQLMPGPFRKAGGFFSSLVFPSLSIVHILLGKNKHDPV